MNNISGVIIEIILQSIPDSIRDRISTILGFYIGLPMLLFGSIIIIIGLAADNSISIILGIGLVIIAFGFLALATILHDPDNRLRYEGKRSMRTRSIIGATEEIIDLANEEN